MSQNLPENIESVRGNRRAVVVDGTLIYIARRFLNPFSFFVGEIRVEEIKAATLKGSILGLRLEIEKASGERICVRGLDRPEVMEIVELVSHKPVNPTEHNGAPTNVQGLLALFEPHLNEIFQDEPNCISRLADLIIGKAIELKASDIHFEPLETVKIRYRIDGVLIDAVEIPFEYHARIVSRIKVLAKLPTYERDVPLDGRIEKDYGPGLDLRVSTFPTIRGDKVVVRIFDSGQNLFTLDELGFSKSVLEQFESLILAPEGTVILTGPSNSGKTTTIYSALERIYEVKQNTVNIATIEDPVERDLRKFSQTQVAPARGLTFASALRSVLRQDPNVIVVGEIRDAETANTAIRAGMTGHLVISTIHSGTASGAFARLLEMGLEPFVLASSISGVMAQRLVRKVCAGCAVSVKASDDLLSTFGIEKADFEERRGAGCNACAGTGYRGRTVIAELLIMNDTLRAAVLARSSAIEMRKIAKANGMRDLLEDGIEKVKAGATNLEELARVLVPDGT